MATWTEIIKSARAIVGNSPGPSSSDIAVQDHELILSAGLRIREIVSAVAGSSTKKTTIFTATPGVQRYLISSVVGADVEKIVEVFRSIAYIPDGVTDPFTSWPNAVSAPEMAGMQMGFIDQVNADRRARAVDAQSFDIDDGYLVLMPPPETAEKVAVRYSTTIGGISDVPDEAFNALVMATTVELTNTIIMRLSQRKMKAGDGEQEYIKTLVKMRDYWQGRYDEERERIRGA